MGPMTNSSGTYVGVVGGASQKTQHVFPGMTRSEVSWRISDHYPLWCEFHLG
jgi:hypothetical protein